MRIDDTEDEGNGSLKAIGENLKLEGRKRGYDMLLYINIVKWKLIFARKLV